MQYVESHVIDCTKNIKTSIRHLDFGKKMFSFSVCQFLCVIVKVQHDNINYTSDSLQCIFNLASKFKSL